MNSPYEWSGHLDHAKELAKRSEEGMQRLAIHAAYYCAFNVARIYVEDVLKVALPQTGDAHEQVWHALERTQSVACKRGRELRKARRKADYEDSFPGDLSEAVKKALVDADEVLKRLPIPP